MYQQTAIIGKLGRDVDARATGGEFSALNFSVATSERYKDKEGNWNDTTEWFRCVKFAKNPDSMVKYLYKGATVSCVGRLKTKEWEDKEGIKRYNTELFVDRLIFLSKPKEEEERFEEEHGSPITPNLDDIPF